MKLVETEECNEVNEEVIATLHVLIYCYCFKKQTEVVTVSLSNDRRRSEVIISVTFTKIFPNVMNPKSVKYLFFDIPLMTDLHHSEHYNA
jgi:hypothetical protein